MFLYFKFLERDGNRGPWPASVILIGLDWIGLDWIEYCAMYIVHCAVKSANSRVFLRKATLCGESKSVSYSYRGPAGQCSYSANCLIPPDFYGVRNSSIPNPGIAKTGPGLEALIVLCHTEGDHNQETLLTT